MPWVVYVLLWVGIVPGVGAARTGLATAEPAADRARAAQPRARARSRATACGPCPAGVGWWPAAVGILAFAWLELVSPDPASLGTLRTAIALYAALELLAAFLYGSRWFDRGDPFEAWSGLYGRISPLGRARRRRSRAAGAR